MAKINHSTMTSCQHSELKASSPDFLETTRFKLGMVTEEKPSVLTGRRDRSRSSMWLVPSALILVCVALLSLCPQTTAVTHHIAQHTKCADMHIEEATKMADVVVSGKVVKLLQDEAHSTNDLRMLKGEIEIKRVFKGDDVVDKMADIMPGRLRPHKMVMVEGFGDPVICHNSVKERDTKIFLLKPNGNGELKLNSSVVTLNLRNLDYVDAVVHNIVYTPEKPKEISPCYLYFCPFGATCHVNETTRQPVCYCEQKCSRVFAPVCGSDGATYSNQCMMDRMSCVRNRRIRHVSHGFCGKTNPCTNQRCLYGAECMPSQDGKTARCQCPSECPNYGDSQGGGPVCGSNGVDYPNMCELRKESCTSMKNIRVKYYGQCDPCQGMRCAEPKVCKVKSMERAPSCECNIFCPTELNFVCGTDGKTYSNICLLRQQACRSGRDIRQLYDGKCSPENNPCMRVTCGPMESCAVDRSGQATCVCPRECEPVLRLVCGNDSNTYDNECELRRRACLDKNYVVVAKQGACGTKSACDGYVCEYGARCVLHRGRPTCECRQCTEEHAPVCGDNGITYENECKLHQENCHSEEHVQVAKRGPCDTGCGKQRCEFYAVCQLMSGEPTCVCPMDCVEVYSPVCGNDGNTYNNECELRVASCRNKTFLTIASRGTCDKCKGVICKHNAKCESGTCVCPLVCPDGREPACGTDGRTYKNECEMRKYACVHSKDIQVAFMGECSGDGLIGSSGDGCDDEDDKDCSSGDGRIDIDDGDEETMTTTMKPSQPPCSVENCINFGGECSLQGVDYVCECNYKCGTDKNPVCGSDGRMYHNECDMALASCIKKERIKKEPVENCDEFDTDEMCGGSQPLVKPDTGADYDCSPGRDTCPDGSYCHYNLQFAKCCSAEAVEPQSLTAIKSCTETRFGCCNDGVTPARGAGKAGCPDICKCHQLGSFSTTCDPISRQCSCRPGVGGKRCDRCQIGYWAMHLIAQSNSGCIPCNCDPYGSARDDCNQMTGRCACKHQIRGMKCDTCSNGSKPGPNGCQGQKAPTSCDDITCLHGGTCREGPEGPTCSCDLDCDATRTRHGSGSHRDIVCGTDGQNYGSECQLRVFACRMRYHIAVDHRGACKGAPPTPVTTSSPVTRSRKTTRHTDGMTGASSEETNGENSQPREESEKECRKRKIGELCVREDCCPTHATCRGVCECRDGYIASLNNVQCVEVKKSPREEIKNVTDACTVNPCETGSCIVDKLLGFRCACPLGTAGTTCNKRVVITTPSFSGRSHLVLPRLEGANQALRIEVTFTSLNDDGIILFNAKHKDGTGDFVSLALRNGFLEFRYDLGGGPAIIKAPVERSVQHRVIARREQNRGSLIVDNGEQIHGSSPATHQSLELNDPLYLGHVPGGTPQTFERIGVNVGLNGCIQSLKAGENRDLMRSYNLASGGLKSHLQGGVDIVECGYNPCQSMPCRNGGLCLVLDKHDYECSCKKGYTGLQCETLEDPCAAEPCQHGGTCVAMTSTNTFFCQCAEGREGLRCERESIPEVYVPQFTGDSYMELPWTESLMNSLRITIWFLSVKPDGVLMFATQSPGGQGDFISLNLINKKLVFTFYLGSGLGVIESKKHIHLDKWHEVTINRTGKLGEMTIDDHPRITGEAKGSSSMLNMDKRPLFLGGFRSPEDLPARAAIKTGFTGAIQKVIINGRTIDGLMASAVTMRNISTYSGPPCKVNPCMNGGVCVPALNLADCRCPSNYMGKNCEKRFEQMDLDQPIQFDGTSFISYPNEINTKQEGQKSNHFYIRFRASQPDGILLLQSGGNTVASDYLLLALDAGHVIFSYNLGQQGPGNLHIIRSQVNVMDGLWHTVRVIRNKQDGTLQVDDEEPVTGPSDRGTQQLDTDGYLWLGGRRDLPGGLPVTQALQGCVSEVKINGRSLHMVTDKMPDAMTDSTAFTFCADKDGA